jgi:hypothetical protein
MCASAVIAAGTAPVSLSDDRRAARSGGCPAATAAGDADQDHGDHENYHHSQCCHATTPALATLPGAPGTELTGGQGHPRANLVNRIVAPHEDPILAPLRRSFTTLARSCNLYRRAEPCVVSSE